MANAVLFNSTIATGGTQQALDPSGVEQLSYSQTLVIKARSTNSGIIYLQNAPGLAATAGHVLEAGDSVVVLFPTTGLFVNGATTGDKYSVAAS